MFSFLSIFFFPLFFRFFFFFFFSSRRRHTRSLCDWSQTCALPISHLRGARTVAEGAQILRSEPAVAAELLGGFLVSQILLPIPSPASPTSPARCSSRCLGSREIGRASCRERV